MTTISNILNINRCNMLSVQMQTVSRIAMYQNLSPRSDWVKGLAMQD